MLSWAEDRYHEPVAVFSLFNGSWSDNEFGLNPRWKECGVRWLIYRSDPTSDWQGVLHESYEIGYRRFMLSLPAGRRNIDLKGLSWPSVQWSVLDSKETGITPLIPETSTNPGSGSTIHEDLENNLTPWLAEHPDVQVLIYIGFLVDCPNIREFSEKAHAPDVNNKKDLEIVRQITDGWLSLSPHKAIPSHSSRISQIGFGFDHSGSGPEDETESISRGEKFIRLAEYFFNQDVFVTGEAIPPRARPSRGRRPGSYAFRAPWFALDVSHGTNDHPDFRRRTWEIRPSDINSTNLGYALRQRDGLNDVERCELIRSAHDRGFTIYAYGNQRFHELAWNSIGIKRQKCDLRFSIQGARAQTDLSDPYRITNNVVTIPGDALSAEDMRLENFLIAPEQEKQEEQIYQIRRTLEDYVDAIGIRDTRDLVVLNMEPEDLTPIDPSIPPSMRPPRSFSPMALGEWERRSTRVEEIIEAYKIRIEIARSVFDKAKIGLFQVVRPDNKGEGNSRFLQRMRGYQKAGELGMYDKLDYLCPPLYARFGSSDIEPTIPPNITADTVNSRIQDSTRQGIEGSLSLRTSKGTAIPLAPYLSFWTFNTPIPSIPGSGSKHNRKEISPEIMSLQLQVLREYYGVEIVVLWSGRENPTERRAEIGSAPSVDLTTFLSGVGKILSSPCSHLM